MVNNQYMYGKYQCTDKYQRISETYTEASLDTQKIVEGCMDRGLMGHGTGHVVYKISKEKGISIREASAALAQGEYWDDAVALFKGGK